MYAIKGAVRYLATDGRGKKAIVVCGDIAEYERGSSGEQTQGAGTVAVLLGAKPQALPRRSAQRRLVVGLPRPRFPQARARATLPTGYAPNTNRYADFPVFNGKYSTFCYLDAVTHAAGAMFERLGEEPKAFYERVAAIFMHRPFHWMPVNGMTAMYVWGLADSEEGRQRAGCACGSGAACPYEAVLAEIREQPRPARRRAERGIDSDPYPNASAVVKAARNSPRSRASCENKMRLGSDKHARARQPLHGGAAGVACGWLREALRGRATWQARPCWQWATAAATRPRPFRCRWCRAGEEAAAKIGFARALEGGVELTREQYERRHDGLDIEPRYEVRGEFVVERVGHRLTGDVQDVGIEYYRYVPEAGEIANAAE